MAKVKKKRNKKYAGADATSARPKITRVQAVNRSRLGQWLHERKKLAKPIGTISLIGAILALVISGIISLF
ncbi:hypothetical protein B7Y94_04805 [Candidatus Saccharibacteria bacterium 32-49-12]|nr:MAG: hypothetical protein B7Y94_04805 [Candidatus Saccharibacteria bacterium 32-49-12]